MAEEGPPALTASERARRAFLAQVEHALAACGVPGLHWTYGATVPPPVLAAASVAPRTILVASLPDVPGEVRVAAVTAVRRVATTRPGGGEAALEQIRAHARSLGIAAVAGTYRTHEPFPAEGTPEYEVTIVEPAPAGAGADQTASDREAEWPVEQRYVAEPEDVAAAIVAWAEAMRRRTLPGPRGEGEMRALRAVAQARRAALAGVDWVDVAALQAAGRLAAAWQAAGLAAAFDPADPEAGIDSPAEQPPAPATPPGEQLARRLAGSGLGAIFDLGVMSARLNEHLERMRAALPARDAAAANAPSAPSLTPTSRATLAEDLAALAPRPLLWHLPRDEQGRLLQGERVLLAAYDSAGPLGQGRQLWLVAALPERRRAPQVPTLRLASLIGANHTHRWDEARWWWDARAQGAPVEERWGVAGLPLAGLGSDAWQDALARQPVGAASAAEESLDPTARAARCLLLQDAGRFEEAFGLYGVALAPEVARLARGEPLDWHRRALAEPWARAVQQALRDAAPWRCGPLLVEAAAARARWLAAKRGRKRPLPELRLLRLPKQTGQSKAVLALAARDAGGGRPWLTLVWTGADDRQPATAWQRDRDLDLLRFGLLAPADLPDAV